jgi:hypothetical protein
MLTSLAFDDHVSSTPIAAVRCVINNVFAQRDAQLSISKSSSDRCRGSRMENKVGLNITDDEYVMLKLKEKEQKQTRSRKPRSSKDKTVKSSKNKTKTEKCRKTATKSKKANKENETLDDSDIAAALQTLEDVIQSTQTIFDDDTSDEEF